MSRREKVLGATERRLALSKSNRTATTFPYESSVHELIGYSETPALIAGQARVTYAELDERANRLAHLLRRHGVGPERRVALCLRRSPELVVAVLAVLKAGGAFVPLDPDDPPGRIAGTVRDAAPAVLIVDTPGPARSGALAPAVWAWDDLTDLVGQEADDVLVSGVTPDNLACVVYTSPSTGVALQHRGVVNTVTDVSRRFGIGPGDRLLALSPPGSDLWVYELLGTLEAGGTLVLVEPDGTRDPARWLDLLHEHDVSIWHASPARLDQLVRHLERLGGSARLPRLRVALVTGDRIPVSLPRRLRDFAPDARFVILGGAPEASIHSMAHEVGSIDPAWSHTPWGRPLGNQRAYVLDVTRRSAAVGVPGELHLAGMGLARCYLGRPDLTARRFVEIALPGGRTERLYRTGKLACYRVDGSIELLGGRPPAARNRVRTAPF